MSKVKFVIFNFVAWYLFSANIMNCCFEIAVFQLQRINTSFFQEGNLDRILSSVGNVCRGSCLKLKMCICISCAENLLLAADNAVRFSDYTPHQPHVSSRISLLSAHAVAFIFDFHTFCYIWFTIFFQKESCRYQKRSEKVKIRGILAANYN